MVLKVICYYKYCYNNSVNWFYIIGKVFFYKMLNEKKIKNIINKIKKFNNDIIFFSLDEYLIFFFKFLMVW